MFLPRECGHVPITAKRPVGRPRKRKPLVETPLVPNIDRANEILCLCDDVGQEAKQIRCQCTTKQKMYVVMRADRTCLARSIYKNKRPPQCRRPLDLYVIVSALILGASGLGIIFWRHLYSVNVDDLWVDMLAYMPTCI